jgi:hypothetical protein
MIQNNAAGVGGNIFNPHDPAKFESYRKSPEFYEGSGQWANREDR